MDMSWRCHGDVMEMSWTCHGDVMEMSWKKFWTLFFAGRANERRRPRAKKTKWTPFFAGGATRQPRRKNFLDPCYAALLKPGANKKIKCGLPCCYAALLKPGPECMSYLCLATLRCYEGTKASEDKQCLLCCNGNLEFATGSQTCLIWKHSSRVLLGKRIENGASHTQNEDE